MFAFLKRKTSKTPKQDFTAHKFLVQTEINRLGSLPYMADNLFDKINEGIDRIVKSLSPSGSNGRVPEMAVAINSFLSHEKVDAEAYWTEVWIRGGRRSMDNYNGKQSSSVQS
jgi:hypothetical protein